MHTHVHKPATKRDQALARIAAAILITAEADQPFAHWLHNTLLDHLGTTTTNNITVPAALTGAAYFTPRDTAHAITLTHWLLSQYSARTHPHTTALLVDWVERREVPKDQIFGIIGIAIIGPTLGLIKSKKKKKSQLRIVLPQAVYEATPKAALSTLTHTLSGRTIAAELRLARGRVSALHPDTAEWLMSDHTTTLYTATPTTFTTLATTLTDCALPHVSHQLSESNSALGISPSLSDAFLADFDVTLAADSLLT